MSSCRRSFGGAMGPGKQTRHAGRAWTVLVRTALPGNYPRIPGRPRRSPLARASPRGFRRTHLRKGRGSLWRAPEASADGSIFPRARPGLAPPRRQGTSASLSRPCSAETQSLISLAIQLYELLKMRILAKSRGGVKQALSAIALRSSDRGGGGGRIELDPDDPGQLLPQDALACGQSQPNRSVEWRLSGHLERFLREGAARRQILEPLGVADLHPADAAFLSDAHAAEGDILGNVDGPVGAGDRLTVGTAPRGAGPDR